MFHFTRCVMARSQIQVVAVLALLLLSAFSTISTHENSVYFSELGDEKSDDIKLSKSTKDSVSSVDIDSWRIGDKWVYDTSFNVSGLVDSAEIEGAAVGIMTGETDVEVEDIIFMDINGTQTLVYEVVSEGDFSTGNSNAALEGYTGRVDMDYEAIDFIRVRDLATISSNFTVEVEFLPYNIGFLSQDIGTVEISNSYSPPNEGYDFPMALGDTWDNSYFSETLISGESDYFDLDGYNTSGNSTISHQVTERGDPGGVAAGQEGGIDYTGCTNSFNVSTWNESGEPAGYKWYCPEVRSYAWFSFMEPTLGMQIDWMLKEYDPVDSQGSNVGSRPGIRGTVLDVNSQFDRVRPDAELAVWANYTSGANPSVNKNLQLRWEIDSIIQSITTKFNGSAWATYDVGNNDDDSITIEDEGSHGVIVWDPVAKIVGVSTVVLDPGVTAIDLVARPDSVVVERIRDGDTQTVPPGSINSIPGDVLIFTMLVQNRGTETSPATEVEVSSPDGSATRVAAPSLGPMESLAFVANWTVPENQAIGSLTLTFEVDPDEQITEDGNKSNNHASVMIEVGRLPLASVSIIDNVLTFQNATIDASLSSDPDGGPVSCDFGIDENEDGVEDTYTHEDDCIIEWAWDDEGEHLIWITVYDDEGDEVTVNATVTVINQAPWIFLSAPDGVLAESPITISAISNDNDSYAQPVAVSWPGTVCNEGLTQYNCTFSPNEEGMMTVTAVATDEDNATTTATISIMVDNRPPVLENVELWVNGSLVDGNWSVYEDETVQLTATGDDTLLDIDSLFYHWAIDADVNPSEMITSYGASSTIDAMWNTSGEHRIQVELFDDDGASGGIENRTINVINIPPVVPSIDHPPPVFEDQDVTISGGATDTASDAENLTLCWDLYPYANTDDNGSADDDCDIEGNKLVHSYTKKGNYTVIFHATDDDGDMAMTNVTITVLNKAPIAILTGDMDLSEGLTVTEGDSYTFYGFLSEDTPSDSDELWTWWDSDCLDSDGDGDRTGDIDVDDVNATFDFPIPATCIITLHIEDTDGGQSTANVTVTIEEMPVMDALMGKITEPTAIVSILILVLALLLVFLLLRGKKDDGGENMQLNEKEWNYDSSPGLMTQATGEGVYDPLDAAMGQIPTGLPPSAETTQQAYGAVPDYSQPVLPDADPSLPGRDIYQQQMAVLTPETPEPQPALTEEELSAPPVPAEGLPPGWSMEQWKYYGAKWLEQQQSSSAATELDDDLDL